MAQIYMKKLANGTFAPDDQQSLELAAKLKVGQVYRHEVKKPRNYIFHKKYFSLLNLAFENQERYDLFEAFRDAITMQAGHYDSHISLTGTTVYKPKSISFASMEELDFDKLYSKTINVILKHVLGCEEDELLEMVLNYA